LSAFSGSPGISVLFRAGRRNASNSLNGNICKRIGALTCICLHCSVRRNGIVFRFQYLPDVILCSCKVSAYQSLMADLEIPDSLIRCAQRHYRTLVTFLVLYAIEWIFALLELNKRMILIRTF